MRNEMALASLTFIALLFILTGTCYAQETYWHSWDSYSVELDGEGDAFVIASMSFEGIQSGTNVTDVLLEIPGRNIRIYKVLQTPSYYGGDYYVNTQGGSSQFLEYELSPLSASTQMTVHLKTPIRPNSQTAISIIYQTQDVAKPTFQGLEFRFETIKDSRATIRKSGANIYVPENMELKGKPKMTTQYLPSMVAGYSSSLQAKELESQIAPNYYRGSYQYTASNLDPAESFMVSGLYGENSLLLYFWEIIGGIAIAVAIVIIFRYFGLAERIRKMFAGKHAEPAARSAKKAEMVKRAPAAAQPQQLIAFSWGRPVIMGIVTAFLFTLASFLSQFIFMAMESGSGYYNYSMMIPFVILVLIVMFALPAAALFGPAIYMYKKYGWQDGIITFVLGVILSAALMFSMVLLAH